MLKTSVDGGISSMNDSEIRKAVYGSNEAKEYKT